MIVVKSRCESKELLMFRSLHLRMGLTGSDAQYYSNLEKGYEGEFKFDQLVEQHLSDDYLAVNDLLLENNHRMFQIDSLLVRQGTIFLNDVKNFDGDYYMKDGKWYTAIQTLWCRFSPFFYEIRHDTPPTCHSQKYYSFSTHLKAKPF